MCVEINRKTAECHRNKAIASLLLLENDLLGQKQGLQDTTIELMDSF